MATRIVDATQEWKELSQSDCIIQNVSNGEYFITYSETQPDNGYSNAFIIKHSGMINLPAPISGSIYVASKNNARIAVEDF